MTWNLLRISQMAELDLALAGGYAAQLQQHLRTHSQRVRGVAAHVAVHIGALRGDTPALCVVAVRRQGSRYAAAASVLLAPSGGRAYCMALQRGDGVLATQTRQWLARTFDVVAVPYRLAPHRLLRLRGVGAVELLFALPARVAAAGAAELAVAVPAGAPLAAAALPLLAEHVAAVLHVDVRALRLTRLALPHVVLSADARVKWLDDADLERVLHLLMSDEFLQDGDDVAADDDDDDIDHGAASAIEQ